MGGFDASPVTPRVWDILPEGPKKKGFYVTPPANSIKKNSIPAELSPHAQKTIRKIVFIHPELVPGKPINLIFLQKYSPRM